MGQRRDFLKKSIAAGALGMLTPSLMGFDSTTIVQTLKPKRLRKGDTVGLIAPGFVITPEILDSASQVLRNLGLVPVHTHRILNKKGYFSNTDIARATDLNEMFANPNIDAILCARGGYGCTRILPLIDFDQIKLLPKILLGFSDVTALLNGIHQKTGLIGFHGPVGSTIDDPFSLKWVEKVLFEPRFPLTLENAVFEIPENAKALPEAFTAYTVTGGQATGKLVGGSLTLINAMIGTPYEIDFTNAIVLLEDVGEAPYRIDRMLTQLLQTPTFNKAAGIALGIFNDCDKKPDSVGFSLKEVIRDRLGPIGIPVAYGLSFGHIKHNQTLPIGIQAQLDANTGLITLLEKAVL
jgi:muramoyltetrapeptide carboxypeptidase